MVAEQLRAPQRQTAVMSVKYFELRPLILKWPQTLVVLRQIYAFFCLYLTRKNTVYRRATELCTDLKYANTRELKFQ